MIKVKFFDSTMFVNDVETMENAINEFCSKVNVLSIQYRTEFDQNAKYISGVIHCALVTYNEL